METAQSDVAQITSEKQRSEELDIPEALRWRVIILCALVCLMDGFDMVVAPIGTPLMAADWKIEPQQFSFALAAAVLGAALGAAFIAPLGDRFGRRPLILASFATVGLSSLAIVMTTTVGQLTVLRFITGLGMGVSFANVLALVSEYSHPHLRSRVVTCVYATSAVGGVFGGLVSPWLIGQFGWQGVYAFGGSIPLLLLIALFFGLPESLRFQLLRQRLTFERPDATHAFSRTAIISSINGALNNLKVLLSGPYKLPTLVLWGLYFFGMFATYMISTWLPTMMKLSGWSTENSVYAITAFSFGGVIGGFVLGWLVDHGKTQLSLAAGFGATAAALGALLVAPPLVPIWLMLIVVAGAGVIGLTYALAAVAAFVYPTELRAGGIGAAAAVGRFGATFAPIVGGWLLASGFSALQILASLIAPMVIAFVIVQLFSKTFVESQQSDGLGVDCWKN